jgi:hypothetical protein
MNREYDMKKFTYKGMFLCLLFLSISISLNAEMNLEKYQCMGEKKKECVYFEDYTRCFPGSFDSLCIE